jgi:hypothetical protein
MYNNNNDNDEESNIETDVDDDSIYCENDNSTNKNLSSKQSSSKGIPIIGAVQGAGLKRKTYENYFNEKFYRIRT